MAYLAIVSNSLLLSLIINYILVKLFCAFAVPSPAALGLGATAPSAFLVKLEFHGTDTDTDTDTDILADFRAFPVQLATSRTRTTILADLSADLSDTRAFPKLHYMRIPNVGAGVRVGVGPVEFQLYETAEHS